MSLLDELEAAGTKALETAGPSVVRIGRGPGRGTGIVFASGVVVTNAHNLRGAQVTVTFADGRSAHGDVAGVDGDGDLAAVLVDTGSAPPIGWGASEQPPAIGRVVFALSLPPGGQPRLTYGSISSIDRAFRGPRGRLIADGLEHTAPLGRGSSGGPVVDRQGRLVGINTHRLGDGFYAAVAASEVLRQRLVALSQGQSTPRRQLGVALAPSAAARRLRAAVGLPERDGLLVRDVEDASPAAAAGLTRGDLLVSADGVALSNHDILLAALDDLGETRTLVLGVVRGVEEFEVTVRFDETPTQA